MVKGNTEISDGVMVDTQVEKPMMSGVNLVKAERVRRHRLSFKEHRAFAIVLSLMGVVIVGLAVAIVVVNLVKNGEEAQLAETELSEKNVKKAALECMKNHTDDVGASINCINSIVDNPAQVTLSDFDGNVLDISYESAIEYAMEYEEYINVANLIVAEAVEWVGAGQCCKARALLQSEWVNSLTPQAKAVLYSGAVGIAKTCDYSEEAERWNELMFDAMKEASELYAVSHS